MKTERLDKILSGTGRYSRSEARRVILAGSVAVDGKTVRRPEEKIPREMSVTVCGEPVNTAQFVYCMMNKPAGYVSASEDERWPAVLELLPEDLRRRGVSCVGRLDIDVTGLLLLSDDGAYAHRVMAPGSAIEKTYEVRLDAPVGDKEIRILASGVTLSSGIAYRPAILEPLAGDPCTAFVTVTEGKYHEVKNLMAVCGRQILHMRRVSIGALKLDESLEKGSFRHLSQEEKDLVFNKI